MAFEIKQNCIIFIIPNSEASIKVQRKTNKIRTVGSYYLSNRADEAEIFLNRLAGHFYVDLSASYLLCKDFYTKLIQNCSSLYLNDLFYLDSALKDIEWGIKNNPEMLFSKIIPPSIIQSRKYLKFQDQSAIFGVFNMLCIGDLCEIVIEKLSQNTFRIFVRPRKIPTSVLDNIENLKSWLASIGRIK